jgi:hypothetical protein
MNVRQVFIAAGVATVIASSVIASAPAASANPGATQSLSGHHTSQSRNGLTCHSSWYNNYGGTSCTGNPNQKWRLHVACQMQPDHDGVWNYGAGSDGFECSWAIDGASVEWG